MERNRKAGQNPPRVVAPIEEEEVHQTNNSLIPFTFIQKLSRQSNSL